MKPVSTYELTFELYHDEKHGYFYNFLVRYYDEKSKVHTNKDTAAEYRLYSFEVGKILNLNLKSWSGTALVHFPPNQLHYLEQLFWKAKNCIFHDSDHLRGRIYDQYFDSLPEMRTDFWCKLAQMKTSLQNDTQFIDNIEQL